MFAKALGKVILAAMGSYPHDAVCAVSGFASFKEKVQAVLRKIIGVKARPVPRPL
jgi:hypothetical protein